MQMRTRSQGGFFTLPAVTLDQRNKDCAQINWTTVGTWPGCWSGSKETIRDVVTPHFERRMAKGEIIMNPYFKQAHELHVYHGSGFDITRDDDTLYSCPQTQKQEEVKQDGNVFFQYVNAVPLSYALFDGVYDPIKVLSDSEISSLVTEVSTDCWANRQLSDSNLFESVAEYNQSMRMFGDVFLRGRSNLNKFLRKPFKGASDVHLMIVYGIIPLVNDVLSVVKGLDKPIGNVRKTTRAHNKIARSRTTSFTFSSSTYAQSFDRIDNDSVEVRCMSLDEYDATVIQNIGFSMPGFLVTPWELIPWSFVLDWFVNVGKFLQALAPADGRKQLGSCYVVRRTWSSYYNPTLTAGAGVWTVRRPVTGGILAVRREVNRVPALAPPGLVKKANNRLTELRRAADALALVIQLISRLRNKHKL